MKQRANEFLGSLSDKKKIMPNRSIATPRSIGHQLVQQLRQNLQNQLQNQCSSATYLGIILFKLEIR